MSHSTQRNDTTVAVLASRIAKCLEKRPDLTLGQLLYESLQVYLGHDEPLDVALNLRRMTDVQLVEALERYVLKG